MDTGWTDSGVVEIDGQLVRFTYHIEGPEHAEYELTLEWPDGSVLSAATNSVQALDKAVDEIGAKARVTGRPASAIASEVANNTPACRAFVGRIYQWAMQNTVERHTDTDFNL